MKTMFCRKDKSKPVSRWRVCGLVLIFPALLLSAQPATVTFLVTAPVSTGRVYITGSIAPLGDWNPGRIELGNLGQGHFQLSVEIPAGTQVEYKFTRGSWNTEALDENGLVPGNHFLLVNADMTVRQAITRWKDLDMLPGAGITGTVRYHRAFFSPQLNNTRDLIIWLPPSYENNNWRRYPVLYLHDGQNLFDPFTSFAGRDWQLDEVATKLTVQGRMQEIIMVGIANTPDRTREYAPRQQGRPYSEFIVHTVKPFVDKQYRTRPESSSTAVMGSSMGGIIAFHLVWEYPQVFSMAGCLSPAFLVDDQEIVVRVQESSVLPEGIRVYIDNGSDDLDTSLQPAVADLLAGLKVLGMVEGRDLLYYHAVGARHNEQSWSERVHRPLLFFFGQMP